MQNFLSLMRNSDLRERLTLSFGVGSPFSTDIAITELGSRSVNEALADGYEPQEVWKAVCNAHPKETEKYRY